MRLDWAGRWTGAACAVAGCMPMIFTLLVGAAGAAGAQAMAMTTGMTANGVMLPGWVQDLGSLSWPLFLLSAALLVWSFWRSRAAVRALAYAGVAVLLINQTHMTLWLFFPGLALVAAAFGLAFAAGRVAAGGGAGR